MNTKEKLFKALPYATALILFLILSYAYFPDVLQGKRLKQHDNMVYKGMSREVEEHREKTGEESLWTNTMFSGMPTYLISLRSKTNLVKHIDRFIQIGPRPASYMFITMLGFFIMLLAFGLNPWIAMIGGVAFGLSSYNLIILAAGHNTKAVAIAYLPMVIGAIYLALKKNLVLGAGLFGLALTLEILANHLQITYYGLLIVLIFGAFELFIATREGRLNSFLKRISVLAVIAFIAILTNFTSIYFTWDYGKDSIRGKSELTINKENQTSGLDKDYATQWSYGIIETFNLFIPNLMGGSSSQTFDKDSQTYKVLKQFNATQMLPAFRGYWGEQPGTSGPVYLGAIIILLFAFGMFLIRGPTKWWILSATILSIILSWGKNFPGFTNFFLDYFPGYNKFRAVSMTLVMAQITIPLLAFLALNKAVKERNKKEILRALKWSTGIVGGIALFFLLFAKSIFDFTTETDKYYAQGVQVLLDAVAADRLKLLQDDALRSLFLVMLSAVLIYYHFVKEKLKRNAFIGLLLLFIVVDLWTIDKRYLNSDNFEAKRKVENPVQASQADKYILKDKSLHYRVLNLSVDPFNDATTSFFHNSIGGYHGAKMRRYQELIEHHISKGNKAVLNMLNTKYIITSDQTSRQLIPQKNEDALGNAWFVESFRMVPNADAELAALNAFDPAKECIIDERFKSEVNGLNLQNDSSASIKLIEYKPNYLKYEANTNFKSLALFSEIFYEKGWKATIDGKFASHFRANYVLRAMVIPEGKHSIEFTFDPPMYHKGNTISLVSSILLILLFAGSFIYYFNLKKKTNEKG